jgi:Asp-tRNA(Asn)/Glu-tRNA(Gln) amidotransferase A subunit family amidase
MISGPQKRRKGGGQSIRELEAPRMVAFDSVPSVVAGRGTVRARMPNMGEKKVPEERSTSVSLDRRRFVTACSAAGVANALLPGVLLAVVSREGEAQDSPGASVKVTAEMIDAAAAIAAISITADQKAMMLDGLNSQRKSAAALRELSLPNSVAPAFVFDPVPPGMSLETVRRPMRISAAPRSVTAIGVSAGASVDESLAFLTVRELAELMKTRKITSKQLTRMYLARLKRLDAKLHCVITLTEERALKQAAGADAAIAAGKYSGPLHGMPWGAKDLLAVKGYPTTWGAGGFEQQQFDEDAEVVKRLDAAGAVLIAKLSMGALAQGDLWGGKPGVRTRNPWNIRQGSSGSSAGAASATSAGCVGFSIGTETLGSISSPSTRCGVTGLRPSFGLVPRTGAMALSWTMDKIGPICRSVEDCAIVLSAIYGPDGRDLAVKPAAFNWDASLDWKRLRVGYLKSTFDLEPLPAKATDAEKAAYERRAYDTRYLTAALTALRTMGVALISVEMPKFPFGDITPVLEAEAAAAFDDLTRRGRDALLAGQLPFDWPNQFRVAHFYSAVDYIQAMRARTLAIAEIAKLFSDVDVIVTPSQSVQLVATNLTGHPAVILPNGIRGDDAPKPLSDEDGALQNTGGPETPVSLTFLGALYSDARLAAFARAYQEATGFHRTHPSLA